MTRPMRFVLFGLLLVCATLAYGTQAPKYIFLFIGDGMGFNHVEASQIYAEKVGTDTGELYNSPRERQTSSSPT